MTTETIQRSIFKMDPEFWHQRMSAGNNGVPQSPKQPAENHSVDDGKYQIMKEFNEPYSYNPKIDKFQDVDITENKPRISPTEVAQNLSADGLGYNKARTPEMSPPASLLQNLSPEQLRNLQSTLASMTQTADIRSLQATAVQNLSTHLQNVMSPNTLSPAEVRNLQALAITNLSSQVQTITNASLSLGDIRNFTTIAVQNLTNHLENLRNQNMNLSANEIRNLTTVAISNLTNHIQNVNQMSQPAAELQRNIAAFQQLAGPNFSAMQNLGGLTSMSNNIAAVSAVLTAAAAQQAALSQQQQHTQGQSQTGAQPSQSAAAPNGASVNSAPASVAASAAEPPENGETEASNGSNSGSNNESAVAPFGSGPNGNVEKTAIGDSSIFMHKSALQMHARDLQTKPHQCQQCLKSFSSNHQLVQHIRVHTGEKPYKCSYCDRRFKQLSHVQQHTRLHTGERPYRCHLPECGRAFIQLSNLQQHLRNHDAQVERAKNRPFHCNICGKGFATESSLRTHTSKEQREALMGIPLGSLEPRLQEMSQLGNVHNPASNHAAAASLLTNQNAVTCPLCHKLFLGAENLMEHMKHAHKDPNASGVPTKRRTANHPCPICGKHYVNEGSLRKHLACHPETAQLSSSLRMWPCSVCQAVFTHESGLLSHMEHMRMDPKHQFAAQYVLSRAAAERRERENLLAAAVAASGGAGFGLGGQSGNSMCPSPAPSDSSSMEHLSSTGSDTGGNVTNNNNNNTKIDLAHMSPNLDGVRPSTPTAMEYSDMPNRMAALNAIVQSQNLQPEPQNEQPQQQPLAQQEKFLDQMTPSNLVMRNTPPNDVNHCGNDLKVKPEYMQQRSDMTPAQVQQLAAMRANLENMRNMESFAGIRSGYLDGAMTGQQQNENMFRMQQQAAEVLLRTQAEALRLAVSQAAAAAASGGNGNERDRNQSLINMPNMPNLGNVSNMNMGNIHGQLSPDLTEALRLQEQRLEQALRLHGGDPRMLGFSLNAATSNNTNSSNTTPNNT